MSLLLEVDNLCKGFGGLLAIANLSFGGFRIEIAEGPPAAIKDNQDVVDAYLGEAVDYSDLRRPEESKLTRDPR
jgi:ABC-type branched-subunit amino acid transport system ATPase component